MATLTMAIPKALLWPYLRLLPQQSELCSGGLPHAEAVDELLVRMAMVSIAMVSIAVVSIAIVSIAIVSIAKEAEVPHVRQGAPMPNAQCPSPLLPAAFSPYFMHRVPHPPATWRCLPRHDAHAVKPEP